MNAKKIVQTFNGRNEWNIGGAGYFKLLSSGTAVDIELYSREAQVLDAPDVESGFYLRTPFERVVITAPVNQEVAWMFAPADGGYDRLAGEVSVIDGGRARTLANEAFFGQVGQVAVAGQLSHVQLWNPAGSGKRAVLTQVIFGASVACGLSLIRHNVALTTLSGAPQSKFVGGTSPACELRSQASAAGLGAGIYFFEYTLANTTSPPVRFAEPIVIAPGLGVLVRGDVNNIILLGSFEFTEEDDV